MAGERPFFIQGEVVEVSTPYGIAYAKVVNGNVYHLHPWTPGIVFGDLKKGDLVALEVTTMLTRVLSASKINNV